MKNFWDERFQSDEYVYGEEPNPQFKNFVDRNSQARILLPGEGEGRNAVYAARKKWDVYAIDLSEEGRKKAYRLANKFDVNFEYVISDIVKYPYEPQSFDAIALTFFHLPPTIRKKIHKHLLTLLKKGGRLFVVGFAQEQLNYSSGGPKDIDMLYSQDMVLSDFSELDIVTYKKHVHDLSEGLGHQGMASLIEFEAIKR